MSKNYWVGFFVALATSACGGLSPTPMVDPSVLIPTYATYQLAPTVVETQTELPTSAPQVSTPNSTKVVEEIPPLPETLSFVDKRRVSELVKGERIDSVTGLRVKVNDKDQILAYYLNLSPDKKMWVPNPILDTGYKYNTEITPEGKIIAHHFAEQWQYPSYELQGMEILHKDTLPKTFWDEYVPLENDTLAIFDKKGNVFMYYAYDQNQFIYAGTELIPPGKTGFILHIPGNVAELTGTLSVLVTDERWAEADKIKQWEEIWRIFGWYGVGSNSGKTPLPYEKYKRNVLADQVYTYPVDIYEGESVKTINVTTNDPVIIESGLWPFGAHSRPLREKLFNLVGSGMTPEGMRVLIGIANTQDYTFREGNLFSAGVVGLFPNVFKFNRASINSGISEKWFQNEALKVEDILWRLKVNFTGAPTTRFKSDEEAFKYMNDLVEPAFLDQ